MTKYKTKQEIFDRVLTKLRDQGKACVDSEGYCVYGTKEGPRCAAGWLVDDPDELRDVGWGGQRPEIHEKYGGLDNVLFVGTLQSIHDNYLVLATEPWEARMKTYAQTHGLAYTPPEGGVQL